MRTFDIPESYRSPVIGKVKALRKVADPRKQDLSPTVLDFGTVASRPSPALRILLRGGKRHRDRLQGRGRESGKTPVAPQPDDSQSGGQCGPRVAGHRLPDGHRRRHHHTVRGAVPGRCRDCAGLRDDPRIGRAASGHRCGHPALQHDVSLRGESVEAGGPARRQGLHGHHPRQAEARGDAGHVQSQQCARQIVGGEEHGGGGGAGRVHPGGPRLV